MRIPAPPPRNPMALELIRNKLYRTKIMRSAAEHDRRHDAWERTAKHKVRHKPED